MNMLVWSTGGAASLSAVVMTMAVEQKHRNSPKKTPARDITVRLLYCLEIDSCANEDKSFTDSLLSVPHVLGNTHPLSTRIFFVLFYFVLIPVGQERKGHNWYQPCYKKRRKVTYINC